MRETRPQRVQWFRRLGPGLITGAADDDPGGIATHSQVGAQFGFNLMWTVALTYPLMTAIQSICARIGRVTGEGLAANMAHVLPRWLVHAVVTLLFVANTVNIGADLAAMGAAARLVLGWGEIAFAVVFAAGSMLLQVFVPYHRYVHVLKWLTLSLLAYVGVVFTVAIDWGAVVRGAFWPSLDFSREAMVAIVAVFGTTISPYMFFWQSAEEVEDELLAGDGALLDHPEQAPAELNRIAWDTYFGMGFSSLISFFIILTTAVTLHTAGITDIATSADAAQALRPIAGEFAFLLFSLGIIGTGLLALPVLAGSAAYAIGELRGWRIGLEQKPGNAKAFYGIIALAFALGLLMLFLPIDPIKALFWSAVLNGVIAVPLMIATMIVVSNRKHLGPFVAPLELRIMGWLATAVMAAAVLTMFGYNVTNTGAATTLTGSKFADTLTGGTGADTLVGGTGADSLVGGDGNDLFVVALAADLATGEVITGGNGTDELRFISTVAASTLTLTSGVAVERVVIGTGTAAAAVTTATTAINVSAAALTSAVTLVGNAGINTLTGGSGGDSLDGGAGNDILVGGAGADTLTGGLGNDTFTVASGTDSITDLNGGCCPQSDIVQLHENPRCPGVCQKGVEMNRRDHRRKS